jgi:hypothetical protein
MNIRVDGCHRCHTLTPVMQAPSWPRLSDAKTFLPHLRAHLAGAAPQYSLPVNISIDLLPIVEDGLFGYELVPDRNTHTYLTIGCCETGEALLRRTMSADAPSALRLAAVDGKSVSCRNFNAPRPTQQRDFRFAEISEAVEAGLSQLVTQFPERPRQPIELQASVHRYLDEALAIAHAHLSDWDPFIRFVGLNEAQYGFALTGGHGESGELLSRRPDMWSCVEITRRCYLRRVGTAAA